MIRAVTAVAGGLLAAAVMAPTISATAATVHAYNGDGERVATAWAPAGGDKGRVAVRDDSAGNWVKAEYYRIHSSPKHTLWNKSGAGRTVYSAHGGKVYKFKACEDIDWGPDHCSKWGWQS